MTITPVPWMLFSIHLLTAVAPDIQERGCWEREMILQMPVGGQNTLHPKNGNEMWATGLGKDNNENIGKQTKKKNPGKSSGRNTDKLYCEDLTGKSGQNKTQKAPQGTWANFLVSARQLSFLTRVQPHPNVQSHKYFKLLSHASKRVIMAASAARPRWAPRESPLTSHSLAGVPANSLHTLLCALNDGYVSVSASTPSGCNFSPLEQTHTCFTLRLQNGRNKALSTEILLKHAVGRPGDIIKQLNKDPYSFGLEILSVIPALLDPLDSMLQSVTLSRMTEMHVVN